MGELYSSKNVSRLEIRLKKTHPRGIKKADKMREKMRKTLEVTQQLLRNLDGK